MMIMLRSTSKRLIPLLALAIFCLAAFSIYHQFGHIHEKDIRTAFDAISANQLALAVLLTMGGYALLSGYDFMALRYIGKRLPKNVVLTTSILGYAVGNTVGFSVFSGGAIRYRLYSRYGLDAADITGIALFCALSFSFGEILSFLITIASSPDNFAAAIPVEPEHARLAAILLVMAVFAFAARSVAKGGVVSIAGLHLRIPSPGMLSSLLLLSVCDLALAASVLFFLLPEAARPEPALFFGWFVVAVGAGLLSHVPGGVGVFEAILAAGLSGTVPMSSLATGLLLYRVIYYLMPFVAAVATILFTSSYKAAAKRTGSPSSGFYPIIRSALAPAVPRILSWLVLLAGSLMVTASLLPLHILDWNSPVTKPPLFAYEMTAIANAAMGMALVILSIALSKRVRSALFIAFFLLIAGALLAWLILSNAVLSLAFAFAALFAFLGREQFTRTSLLSREALSRRWLATVGGVIGLALFILFFSHRETAYSNELWFQFAFDAHASRALRAALAAALIALSGLLYHLLRPFADEVHVERPSDADLTAIIANSLNANAGLVFTGDKEILLGPDRHSFLMFASQGRSLVAFEDPVTTDGQPDELVQAFILMAERSSRRPFFYEISSRTLPAVLDTGMRCYKIGEEAIVDLGTFSLSGKKRRGLRSAHNRAVRDALSFTTMAPPHDRSLLDALQRISAEWLAEKAGSEKGFSVGKFAADYLEHFPLAVAFMAGKPVAFANIMAASRQAPATIDLMRHSGEAPPGVMEFLFIEIMLALKAKGYQSFSLGIAPLSGIETMRRKRLWEHAAVLAFRHGNKLYGFKGLRAFKEKFRPDWLPRYAAAFSAMDFASGLLDAASLINRSPDQHKQGGAAP
jgi:phosphatidylglycerol lysyltransferase